MAERVVFRDAENRRGCITEDLEVYYGGTWEETVEEYIERVERRYCPEVDEVSHEDVYTRLLIGLPEEAPIVEIERADDPGPCPPP